MRLFPVFSIIVLQSFILFPIFGFSNSFISFDHPDGWKCEKSQGVFICQGTEEPERKESLVMAIAIIAGEKDTFEDYEKFLKTPQEIYDESGNPLKSEMRYVRRQNINGFDWIDSLQYNRELPGFWARYLATIHNKLAILVTYVVSDENYSKMAPQFERMIKTLKPNAEFNLNSLSSQASSDIPTKEVMGKTAGLMKDRLNPKKGTKPSVAPENPLMSVRLLITVFAIFVLVVVAFARIRKSKT